MWSRHEKVWLTLVVGIATATEIKNANTINDFILKLKFVCRAETFEPFYIFLNLNMYYNTILSFLKSYITNYRYWARYTQWLKNNSSDGSPIYPKPTWEFFPSIFAVFHDFMQWITLKSLGGEKKNQIWQKYWKKRRKKPLHSTLFSAGSRIHH